MNQKFVLSEKSGVLVVTVTAVPTADELIEVLTEIRNDTGYTHQLRLWDFRKSEFNPSDSELKKIAMHAAGGDEGPSKIAMLVGSDFSYGMSRMYYAYRSNEKAEVNVFRDEADAMNWLRGPGETF